LFAKAPLLFVERAVTSSMGGMVRCCIITNQAAVLKDALAAALE
jgi:hypothetical protein